LVASVGVLQLGETQIMRGLDGQARIFIGSSSEGRAAAERIEAVGMRPLLWLDFFKTRDLPVQELDRRMEDADGAILVGSADDRLISRGKDFDQMRDNVLLEYGLFAGYLGRHRCILLMPDHPRFRIQTLDAVVKKVPERLQAALAADGFKPPSLQERCRRLLLFSGWMRGEIAKIELELSGRSLIEQLGEKIEGILCFLKEDIDKLGLREDAAMLEVLVRKSFDHFPQVDRESIENQLQQDVQNFVLDPCHYSLTSRLYDDKFRDKFNETLVRYFHHTHDTHDHHRYWTCPWCSPYQDCLYPVRGVHCHCIGEAWFMGAVDMLSFLRSKGLAEFGRTIDRLEQWQQNWVPDILDRLGAMEQTVHKQIFGHL
jgi:hypothetical protein